MLLPRENCRPGSEVLVLDARCERCECCERCRRTDKDALLDPEDQPSDWDGGILMQKVSNPDAVRQAHEIQLRCHMNPDFDTNTSKHRVHTHIL